MLNSIDEAINDGIFEIDTVKQMKCTIKYTWKLYFERKKIMNGTDNDSSSYDGSSPSNGDFDYDTLNRFSQDRNNSHNPGNNQFDGQNDMSPSSFSQHITLESWNKHCSDYPCSEGEPLCDEFLDDDDDSDSPWSSSSNNRRLHKENAIPKSMLCLERTPFSINGEGYTYDAELFGSLKSQASDFFKDNKQLYNTPNDLDFDPLCNGMDWPRLVIVQ